MKFISWNVNGLRACVQKGFIEYFQKADADFFCLQETKLQEGRGIIAIGIMRCGKAIPALPFLPSGSLCQCPMA